ncbi:MAG: thioredoxin domain-containing protein [Phycisphaerales bacterium]|nr:thioredoxin domain-containing protein [Phycisphaerales bacterium]
MTPSADSAPADPAASTSPAAAHRLARSTSPYLQQHAHNPVEWYEWGDEALALARRENRPIFLSIGYSACHWCHVMAHESFEDPAVAAVMNRWFVNIKVDREERPDIDDIYMQATLAYTNGQGGWPMSVWLTPDLKPFAAGTYFPPTARYGRPGFGELCERIGQLWTTHRDALQRDADTLTEHLRAALAAPTAAGDSASGLSLELIDRAADILADAFDAQRGGLLSGGTNKFPPSMAMELFLRSAHRSTDAARREKLLQRVFVTLDQMAAGGINDQLAGGIARYSTDPDWLVPHFEKMLNDQALVARVAIDAHRVRPDAGADRFARSILDYCIEDLRAPGGGFYSSRDADSEGREGAYYVWRQEEIVQALGAAEAELFCAAFGVRPEGNWSDPHEPGAPKNILHLPAPLLTLAEKRGISPDELQRRLDDSRRRLLAVRRGRPAPHRDEKILCEWNGLLIAALARAGRVLDEPRYTSAAAAAADFILREQRRGGRLLRSWRDGRTLGVAFVADYANLIDGLIELYEATWEPRWLIEARALCAAAVEHYWDDAGAGFFTTADDHEALIVRARDLRDSATPSGNSVMLMNLLRLGVMLGERELTDRAGRMLLALSDEVRGALGASERFLCGADFALAGAVEIAIIGDPDDPRTRALRRAADLTYIPGAVVMGARPGATDPLRSPLLADRPQVGGLPTAYVCRNYVCDRPETSPDALLKQLARIARPRAQ